MILALNLMLKNIFRYLVHLEIHLDCLEKSATFFTDYPRQRAAGIL